MADSSGPIYGALIALAGVIGGWIYNRFLQLHNESRQERSKRAALRAALKAEFKSIYAIAEAELPVIRDKKADYTWIPIQDFPVLSKVSVTDIGILSEAEVDAIFMAYHTYNEHIGYISRKGDQSSYEKVQQAGRNIGYDITKDRGGLEWSMMEISKYAFEAIKAMDAASGKRCTGFSWYLNGQ